VKLLGGGALPTSSENYVPYFVVETPEGRETLVPSLLGRLCRFAALRERNGTLWTGLRSRAQEWCKEAGLLELHSALLIPTHVARAFLPSAPELAAAALAESHGYDTTVLASA